MDLHNTVFEVIDMRSFSNLWYWIGLAVLWSSASHWILGVPFDLIQRASRKGGAAMEDLEGLVRINVNRIHYIFTATGLWLIGIASFTLTMLALLGFYYLIEFCQAVFLMAFPMSLVTVLSAFTARRIRRQRPKGDALVRALRIHRLGTQVIGVIAILVTALWGMYQNLSIGALGG
ncbi:component of SufBCD complex [Actibacterium sp. XHP0104]|uniref:component of SufBCD complex n=1 Tax=Actibacterium sp. XHP0104 TaxID=2984335 RepID=UPI0021E844E0|nr:component of SufBCD complex [Actibacterium sp. XHP0104]MCV2881077.1 component of SufBCD complex [Actibacterium sp. XHP0104]